MLNRRAARLERFASLVSQESLARYTMNDEEMALITASEHPEVEFIRLWTMKEAELKLSGEGIRNDMKSVLTGFASKVTTVINEEKNYIYTITK